MYFKSVYQYILAAELSGFDFIGASKNKKEYINSMPPYSWNFNNCDIKYCQKIK